MNFLNFVCPPLPYYVIGGEHIYRPGDTHERRVTRNVFDLLYVQSGCLWMEQEPLHAEIPAGHFFILTPDTPHKGSRVCTEKTAAFWLHFYTAGEYSLSEEFIPDCTARRATPKFYYSPQTFTLSVPRSGSIPEPERAKAERYLQRMSLVSFSRYTQKKSFPSVTRTPYELQTDFLNFLELLYAPYCSGYEKESIAAIIRGFLDSHYMEPVSLTRLARQYSYSTSHLIRCFNQAYQISPMQYLKKRRIEQAARLLLETDLSVHEIGERVGLRIPSYFIRQFKQETGFTPAQYRAARPQAALPDSE